MAAQDFLLTLPLHVQVDDALKILADVRVKAKNPKTALSDEDRSRIEKDQIDTLKAIVSGSEPIDASELESICTLVFRKSEGIMCFLKDAPKDKPSKETKAEAFSFLVNLIEKMAAQDLLVVNSPALREIKDICLQTFRVGYESAKLKEESLAPVSTILRYCKGKQIFTEEEVASNFDSLLYDHVTAKSTSKDSAKGVQKNVYKILGLMCKFYGKSIAMRKFRGKSDGETLLGTFFRILQNTISVSARDHTQSSVLAGCLDGLCALLYAFPQEASAYDDGNLLRTAYIAVCQSISAAVNDDVKRYELSLASLNILAKHSRLFCEWFHCERSCRASTVCENLLGCCEHKNIEVRRKGLKAMDAWLGCLKIGLSPVDHRSEYKDLLKLFDNLSRSSVEEVKPHLAAIRGYGALASAMREIGAIDILQKTFNNASTFIERLMAINDKNNERYLEVIYQLPDIVIAFADMLCELPQASQGAIEFLDKMTHALFANYITVHSSRRFSYERAWFYLLSSAERPDSTALQQLLERTVFRAIVTSIEPTSDPTAAPPGMLAQGNQLEQPCVLNSNLWKSLNLDKDENIKWMRQRGRDGFDPNTKTRIAGMVYHHMFEGIIVIINKLDLTLENYEQDEGANEDEHAAEAIESSADMGLVQTFSVQASGMSGRERPRCQRDVEMFLNLVLMCQLVMKNIEADFFRRVYLEMCKTLVRNSSKHPLFSGFFKLLALSMRIIDNGHFLQDIVRRSAGVYTPRVSGKDQQEAAACAVLLSKFAKEVVLRSDQLFDDLLAASLEFVLTLPSQLRDFQIQVPALTGALKLGIDSPQMAILALDSLENWVSCNMAELRGFLPQILPLLNDFLFLNDNVDLGDAKIESKDVKQRRAQAQRRRAMHRGQNKRRGETDQPVGAKDMALRTMRLLGKLGSDNMWLVQDSRGVDVAGGGAQERLDSSMNLLKLKIDLNVAADSSQQHGRKSITPAEEGLLLDSILPRIAHLAEKSIDRKLKVAACEVLHAIVVLAIGTHNSKGTQRSGERSPELQKFDSLFRFLLPIVFRLAVNTETITSQLFHPLALQIIHWFTSKTGMDTESDILLDAILDGVEETEDGKVREAASKFLSEYVTWTLKELKSEEHQENAIKTKQLLRRLYALMNHPSVSKRIGAFLAVRELGRSKEGLRRFERVIDQFLLELMHHCILSLKFADRDDPALQTAKAGVTALYGLADGILLKPNNLEMLIPSKRKGKHAVNPRRLHPDLPHFVEWLFDQIGSHEKDCRRYCMDLFTKLSGKMPGCSKPEDWIKHNKLGALAEAFEDEHVRSLSVGTKLSQEVQRMQHLTTALDAYEWVLNAAYARPEHVFTSKSSLVKAIDLFVSNTAVKSSQLTDNATPSEVLRYAQEKSKCLYALSKFMATLLERYPNYDTSSKEGRILVGEVVLKAVLLSLLAPGKLELDVISDPLVLEEIPRQVERLLHAMSSNHRTVIATVRDKVLPQLVKSHPELQLIGMDFATVGLNSDELRLLFNNYSLLYRAGVVAADPSLGKQLMQSMWSIGFESANPADKAVAEAVLRLSFKLQASFLDVYKLVFEDVDASGDDNWQNSKAGMFYNQFRLCILESFAANLASAVAECSIFQRAINRAPLAGLLVDLVNSRVRIESSVVPSASQAQVLQTSEMMETLLANLTALEDLGTARDTDGQVRNRQATDVASASDTEGQVRQKQAIWILNGMVSLRPERCLDDEMAPKVCRIFCTLATFNPVLSPSNVAELLEALPAILDRAPSTEVQGASGVIVKVRRLLENYIPASSTEFKEGTDLFVSFSKVFSALLGVIKRCKTPAVYPLIRDLVVKEKDHIFKAQIEQALDEYALGMDETSRKSLANKIMLEIQTDSPSDAVSLQVQRNVMHFLCLRLVHGLEYESVIQFFVDHSQRILDMLKADGAGNMPIITKKICFCNALQAVYQNLQYADIKTRVHPTASDYKPENAESTKHLTGNFVSALRSERKNGRFPSRDEQRGAFFLLMRTVNSTLGVIICRTQGRDDDILDERKKKRVIYDTYLFKEVAWEKIVDVSAEIRFEIEVRFQKSRDELAAFRNKRMIASKSDGRRSASSLAFGSLTQDVAMGFGSFAGSAMSLSAFDAPAEQLKISDGSEIPLEHDLINENESMRPFLALLDHMNRYFRPVLEQSPPEMPVWMEVLRDKLMDSGTAINIRLFIAKIIINHNKLSAQRANPNLPDMFKPFASEFFDAFFHTSAGLVLEVSRPPGQEGDGLRVGFNYFVRDVCLLWMDWMAVSNKGLPGFTLKVESQVKHGWGFIKRMLQILIHNNPHVTQSNARFLEYFVAEWRMSAKEENMHDCIKCIIDMLGAYKKVAEAKKELPEAVEKDCQAKAKAGLQALLVFTRIELDQLQDKDKAHNMARIRLEDLKEAFGAALRMVMPAEHKNKVNRMYSARNLLVHASAACVQVIACAAESGDLKQSELETWGEAKDEMLKNLTEQLQRCFMQNKMPDQLLVALSTVVDNYMDFAATRFCQVQIKSNIYLHGSFLNMVQSMLIAYVACIWKEPSVEERDKSASDLQMLLMRKRLKEMLAVNDEKTQMLALRLLTGRAENGQQGSDNYRTSPEPKDLLPPPPSTDSKNPAEKRYAQHGLLPFLPAMSVREIWEEIKSILPKHQTEGCRFHFYLLVIDLCTNLLPESYKEPRNLDSLEAHKYLVPALSDNSDRIRNLAFEWWDKHGLPNNGTDRVLSMLERMHSPAELESEWLNSSAVLMLELARHSPRCKINIFDSPLDSQTQFKKYSISTSIISSSLPMAPMFALGSLPVSASQAGSQMQPFSQVPASAGGILATLQVNDEDTESMDVDDSAEKFLANQTQQAGMYIPRRRPKPNESSGSALKQQRVGGAFVSERRGGFAVPMTRFDKTDKTVKDDNYGRRVARIHEEIKEKKKRSQAARSKQVQMRRSYRVGEVPDIQIPVEDIIKTLQRVALRDSATAKIVFVKLYGVIHEINHGGSEYMRKFERHLESMLNEPNSSDMVEALLDIADTSHTRLNAALVARACARPEVCSFYHGIRALENQARRGTQREQKQDARKRGREKHATKHTEEATEMTDDDWVQLSRMYAMLEERDIVLGLCDKTSRQEGTRDALQYELLGDYKKAAETYKRLMRTSDLVDEGKAQWEGGEPSEVEVDQWNRGMVSCLKGLLNWEQLKVWVKNSVLDEDQDDDQEMEAVFEKEIWERRYRAEMHTYVRCLVGLCSEQVVGGDKTELESFIEDCWFDSSGKLETRKQILRDAFGREAALALLLGEDQLLEAKDLVKKGMDKFLVEWSSSESIGLVAKRLKLRSLQQFVELGEYISAVEGKISAVEGVHASSLSARFRGLARDWGDRLPSKYDSNTDVWNQILTSRLVLMRKQPKAVKLDNPVDRLYLSMSKVARRHGSLDVAETYLRHAETSGGDSLLCVMSKAKLGLARSLVCEALPAKLVEIKKANQVLDNVMIAETDSETLKKKYFALRAFTSWEKLRYDSSQSEDKRTKARQGVLGMFEEALRDPSEGNANVLSKIHLRMALFCDSEIERDSAKWAGGDKNEFVCKYITNMLAAMRLGSIDARSHFPRVLELAQGHFKVAQKPFEDGCKDIPPWMMLQWLPQVISLIARTPPEPCAQAMVSLLANMATEYPQAVYYAIRVVKYDVAKNRSTDISFITERAGHVEKFCRHLQLVQHPRPQVQYFVENLLLPAVRETNTTKGNVEAAALYKEVWEDCLDKDNPDIGQYRQGTAKDLKKQVQVLGESGILQTLNFTQVEALHKVFKTWVGNEKDGKWKIVPNVQLGHLSPKLQDYEQGTGDEHEVCIPGQHLDAGFDHSAGERGLVKLVSCDSNLLVLPSLMMPKRLKMRGSDGKEYWWLVKGGEDVRQDERVQQVFRCMNQVLAADVQCAQRRLSIMTYKVVPISKLFGLIEWVRETKQMKEMIESYGAHDEQTAAVNAYQNLYGGCQDSKSYLKVVQTMTKRVAQDNGNAFREIEETFADDMIRRALMAKAQTAQEEFEVRDNFARSLSTSSCCQYILGIGDRHLANLLIHTPTGTLVPIDFGHAFGSATQLLPVPELVPFRMTRQMLGVLAPLDAEGLLKRSMTHAMGALRRSKPLLRRMLEIFVSDPTVDWAKQANLQAAKDEKQKVQWLAENKISVFEHKLDGMHPSEVLKRDLEAHQTSNIKDLVKRQGYGLVDVINGSDNSIRKQLLDRSKDKGYLLSPKEQVDALVDLARDPAVRCWMWRGWEPWM